MAKKFFASMVLVLMIVISGQAVSADKNGHADSNPAGVFESIENVELLGHLPGSFGAIEVDGKYAYTECNSGLCVIDVSNPYRPRQISFIDTEEYITQIVLDGEHLFAARSSYCCHTKHDVLIIDIRDPYQPRIMGSVGRPSNSGWISDLVVQAHKNLYISIMSIYGVEYGIYIVDISDPGFPQERGVIDVRPDESEAVNGLAILGDEITVLHGEEYLYDWIHGLARYDITNPSAPVDLGRLEPDTWQHRYGNDVIVYPDRAYVLYGGDVAKTPYRMGGLEIYDISTPSEITFLRQYGGDISFYSQAIIEDYAYLLGYRWDWTDGRYEWWLKILNVHSPDGINEVGSINFPFSEVSLTDDAGLVYLTDYGLGLYILRYAVSESLTMEYGGVLIFDDPGGVKYAVHVPQVAMLEPTDLFLAPITDYVPLPGYALVGDTFELSVYQDGKRQYGFPFTGQIYINAEYPDELLDLFIDESQLTLRWWDGSSWVDATETCTPNTSYDRDLDNNDLRLPVCKLGRYGLFRATETHFLPIVSK